jgi:hypothetical protein
MDSVESMKLSSIIKNRKAMTPLMIGIIIAASVLAVFFVVMTATIPLYGRELDMTVKENTFRGNVTSNIQLSFRIICDYDIGILKKVMIFKDTGQPALTPVAANNETPLTFHKSQEITITYNFTVDVLYTPLPPEGENPDGLFIFARSFEYTLRIYFENPTGSVTGFKDYLFVFDD